MCWKTVELPNTLHLYDFKAIAKKEPNPRVRIRLLAMEHLKDGLPLTQTAAIFKVTYPTVSKWLSNFKEGGINGLKDKHKSGRKCKFNYKNTEKLIADIEELAANRKGGTINGKDIQKLLKDKYSADYKLNSVYELLHRINLSWISCRSKHPNVNINAQENFKKTLRN